MIAPSPKVERASARPSLGSVREPPRYARHTQTRSQAIAASSATPVTARRAKLPV